MKIVSKSKNGIDYIVGVLLKTQRTVSRAILWRIPHDSGREDISLKIGRYNKKDFVVEEVEIENPRSELTLKDEEFRALLKFLNDNYEPFRQGERKYIPLDEKFDPKNLAHVKAIFNNPNKEALLSVIAANDLLPNDLVNALEYQERVKAISEFQKMLDEDLLEQEWQKWLEKNDWVLGSDFVRILDEREIDTQNIADYLMEAYDGFLDIIEIKRPEGGLTFWAGSKDHGNYVPSSELTKAIMQAARYICEVEREANSVKFLERVDNVKTIKPRCVLIFGRSNKWDREQREACRVLNACYHNLSIMTYDHVLARAKRILGIEGKKESGADTEVVAVE